MKNYSIMLDHMEVVYLMRLIIDCCFLTCKSGSIKVEERLRAVAMTITLHLVLIYLLLIACV